MVLGRAHLFTGVIAGVLVSLADLFLLIIGLKAAISVYRRHWTSYLFKNPFLRFAAMGIAFWLLVGPAAVNVWGIVCGLVAGLAVSVWLIGRAVQSQKTRERRSV